MDQLIRDVKKTQLPFRHHLKWSSKESGIQKVYLKSEKISLPTYNAILRCLIFSSKFLSSHNVENSRGTFH